MLVISSHACQVSKRSASSRKLETQVKNMPWAWALTNTNWLILILFKQCFSSGCNTAEKLWREIWAFTKERILCHADLDFYDDAAALSTINAALCSQISGFCE